MKLGIDIGFSQVKCATGPELIDTYFPNNQLVIPSAVTPAVRHDIRNSDLMDDLTVLINGSPFDVGLLAKKGGREFDTKYLPSEGQNYSNGKVLLLTTIAIKYFQSCRKNGITPLAKIEPEVTICMPILNYTAEKDRVLTYLKGSYEVELVTGEHVFINLQNLNIIQEGLAALYSILLDKNGNPVKTDLEGKVIGFIDMGWKTINFFMVDWTGAGLRYDDDASGTFDAGLSQAFTMYAKRAYRESGIRAEDAERFFLDRGKPEIQQLADQAKKHISMYWTRKPDVVYFTGGGGNTVYSHFGFKPEIVKVVPCPIVANAIGAWKYTMMG